MSAPGGPEKKRKVWKGEKRSGPAPARHIPWPEIFKHHISVVEGHMKMVEMVQKHTTAGTGNYETITNLVKRSHEMLRQAKDISKTFIPPKNQREMVPLGSSSESMYPGYSPADIEYGKAAGEFGQALGELKAKGANVDMPANGPEYKIGQAHGAKRKFLFNKESTSSEGVAKQSSAEPEPTKDGEDGGNPYFVIDTNPTPVVIVHRDSKKRPLENGSEPEEVEKKDKKKKKSKEQQQPVIQTEDISAEVEARLKAKDGKKKKRKRESTGDEEKELKKSKREKSKKHVPEEGEEGSGDVEEKKKRKKNKVTE